MARLMVIARKASPGGSGRVLNGDSIDRNDDATDQNDDENDDENGAGTPDEKDDEAAEDVAECPNCGCKFDEASGDVVKPGAKVEGGQRSTGAAGYGGKELDALDDAEPVPGKAGTAHDAALGDMVMSALMGGIKPKVGSVR